MRSTLCFFLILLLASFARAQDFQQWNEIDLTASWRKADFLIPLLARTDSSLPNPQLAATGVLADVRLPLHLTLTAGYLFADLPQASYKVHVPLIALTPTFHLGRLTIADRNRFEKLVGYPTDPVRYRNRLLVDCPFGPRERWHVFTDDEIFFNLTAADWNQNRFQAGGGARLSQRLDLDVYYLQKNPAGNAPVTHVLGTTLTIGLRPRPRENLD